MKSSQILFTALAISLAPAIAEPLPDVAQDLLTKREEAIARIDEKLNGELKKVKLRFMKEGKLEDANAVDTLIKETVKPPVSDIGDPLINSVWNFLGVNNQKINEFVFLPGGKVECESKYKDATWRRLDKINVLFSYGTDESHIVFRVTDASGKKMSGYHYSGRPRHLVRIK